MHTKALVRSWRDHDFAETLSAEEKKELLPSPVGDILLSIFQDYDLGSNSTSVGQPTHCSTSAADCCGTSVANTCSTSVADCCN
jgi:hypothetical protein